MRTVIYAQARTGSTALFLRLQAALETQIPCFFEPEPDHVPATGDVLVKSLVMSVPEDLHCSPLDATSFDRRLVLVRDPRDRLISVLLFLLQWSSAAYPPLWQQAPHLFAALLRLLRRKEQAPASVAVAQLFEAILWARFGLNRWQAQDQWRRLQNGFLAWHAAVAPQETIRYELLMTYPKVALPRAYASLRRQGRSGEWRQWFTPRDVAYFRPLLLSYLLRYHYADDWTLPAEQTIDPSSSSRYVEKWVRVQRRQAHAHPLS